MKKRPDFISQEDFRGWRTRRDMEKMFAINKRLPTSYIAKWEREGKTFKTIKETIGGGAKYRVLYKPIQIIAKAYTYNLPVTKPIAELKTEEYGEKVKHLSIQAEALSKRVGYLNETIKYGENSLFLTGQGVATKKEILTNALSNLSFSGVYFLIKGIEIVYVGQSVNVHSRVATHFADKDFDSFCYIECLPKHLDVLESLYIHIYQPRLNGRLHGRMRSPLSLEGIVKAATDGVQAIEDRRREEWEMKRQLKASNN